MCKYMTPVPTEFLKITCSKNSFRLREFKMEAHLLFNPSFIRYVLLLLFWADLHGNATFLCVFSPRTRTENVCLSVFFFLCNFNHFLIRDGTLFKLHQRSTSWQDTSWIKLCIVNIKEPINKPVTDSLLPQMTTVFSRTCVATFMSFSFQRLLAALSVNPPWGASLAVCVCVCVCVSMRVCVCNRKPAQASVILLSSSLWCLNWGQMLWDAKEPTCPLSDCQTPKTPSLCQLIPCLPLPLSCPCLSFYVVQMGASTVPLKRRSLQQHQVVCGGADRNVVWEDLLPSTPKDPLSSNPPFSSVASPVFEPGCRNPKLLFCNNVDHPTLPKRTKLFWFK